MTDRLRITIPIESDWCELQLKLMLHPDRSGAVLYRAGFASSAPFRLHETVDDFGLEYESLRALCEAWRTRTVTEHFWSQVSANLTSPLVRRADALPPAPAHFYHGLSWESLGDLLSAAVRAAYPALRPEQAVLLVATFAWKGLAPAVVVKVLAGDSATALAGDRSLKRLLREIVQWSGAEGFAWRPSLDASPPFRLKDYEKQPAARSLVIAAPSAHEQLEAQERLEAWALSVLGSDAGGRARARELLAPLFEARL